MDAGFLKHATSFPTKTKSDGFFGEGLAPIGLFTHDITHGSRR